MTLKTGDIQGFKILTKDWRQCFIGHQEAVDQEIVEEWDIYKQVKMERIVATHFFTHILINFQIINK
jgi:hypothetical protein